MQRYQFTFPPLYFLHIPKTAGTSLKFWLYDFYSRQQTLRVQLAQELDQVTREEINRADLIAGHFGWQMFRQFDRPRKSMTWLRDPIKRAISGHRYSQQQLPMLIEQAKTLGKSNWIEHYLACQNRSLIEIIDSGRYVGYLDNFQVRHLSDSLGDGAAIAIDESRLELAKRNLDSMSFVGICEWMEQSIDLCCYQLGFPHHPLRLHYNTTVAEPNSELSASDLERLRHIERYDYQLYNYAASRFQIQFAEFWNELAVSGQRAEISPDNHHGLWELLQTARARYQSDEVQQAVKDRITRKFSLIAKDLPLVEEAELNVNDTILFSNFHPRWPGQQPGKIIRWAGPENVTSVQLPLKPGFDYEVGFNLLNHIGLHFVQQMKLFANGHPVLSKISFVKDQGLVWLLIPKHAIHDSQLTELSIQISEPIPKSPYVNGLQIIFACDAFWFRALRDDNLLSHSWLTNFHATGAYPDILTPSKLNVPIPALPTSAGLDGSISTPLTHNG